MTEKNILVDVRVTFIYSKLHIRTKPVNIFVANEKTRKNKYLVK